MANMNKVAKELKKAMIESDNKKPKAYDTEAIVSRVDGDTLWVNFPGSENETPVRRTIDAKAGDVVMVRVANHRAWTAGNQTNPPTDDTQANYASEKASTAINYAGKANEAANNAIDSAMIANQAAKSAEVAAKNAWDYADDANTAATNAWNHADDAWDYADDANTAATNAWNHADDANNAAISARNDAAAASRSANSALTQLSVVEDVVGTLSWISEHATYKASSDTEVIPGKLYFTKDETTYTPISNPTGNPSTSGYYEIDSIDEAVSNYVASHLSLTDAGLWVVNDNDSYKILLASDGMKVYDSEGNLVSTFGESIEFSSSRPQYIGGDNAYIVFNPTTGIMTIGGSQLNISGNVTIGGQTRPLSQVLIDMQSEIDGSIENWYLNGVPTSTNQPAVNWTTTAQKNQHLRDLYFDLDTGHTYRWAYDNNEYKWIEIEDTDATAALAAAQTAQATADSKVSDVVIEYAQSTSPTIVPESGWKTGTPTWENDKYIWQRTTKIINGETNYTYTCIQGAIGATGPQGETGDQGPVGIQGPAGPEAVVMIGITSIDWLQNTAVLTATTRVNGELILPTYSWTKNTNSEILGTSGSITITDFASIYHCKAAWTTGSIQNHQVGSLDFNALISVYSEAAKHANNYLGVDDTGIMVYDGSDDSNQKPATPISTTNNVYIDNDKVCIRRGMTKLAEFSSSGMSIYYDGNLISSYGESTIIGNENDFHIKISVEDGLEFYQATDRVAYMNNNMLFIENSEITDNLRIGQFLWKKRNENRISFRYEPNKG